MSKKILGLGLALSISILIGIGCAPTVSKNYSAESITNIAGRTQNVKIFITPDKQRIEASSEAKQVVTIIRKDLKVAWIIMPDQKVYLEQALSPEQLKAEQNEKLPGEIERKKAGTESINGEVCEKYEITFKPNPQVGAITVLQWLSTDKIPVRSAALDGAWYTEYRNIQRGPQSAALFELPKDYKKFSLTAPAPSTKEAPAETGKK